MSSHIQHKRPFFGRPFLWVWVMCQIITFAGGFFPYPYDFFSILAILVLPLGMALVVHIIFIFPIILASRYDEELRGRLPHTKPFKWGFYLGIMWKVVGIFYGISCLYLGIAFIVFGGIDAVAGKNSEAIMNVMFGGFFGIVILFYIGIAASAAAVVGHYVIKRKKWAWIVITVGSGPIGWLINGIYGANRWDEFNAEATTSDKPPRLEKTEDFLQCKKCSEWVAYAFKSCPHCGCTEFLTVCPNCAETINAKAKKCRYCHEWLKV